MLRVEGIFHWGFWIRQAYASARQETLPLPPPSTLVGALVSGLAIAVRDVCAKPFQELKLRNSAAYEVPLALEIVSKRVVEEVYFKITDGHAIKKMDITRHFQAPYLRANNWADKIQWFAVRSVGKVYAPNTKFEISYLINLNAMESLAKNLCRDFGEDQLLYLASMNISRIGPVEAVVTPKKVELNHVICRDITYVPDTPCPYFEVPKETVEKLRETLALQLANVTLVSFWNWRKPEFWSSSRRPDDVLWYVVPVDGRSYESGFIPKFSSCRLIEDVLKVVGRGVYVGENLYPVTTC